jgi:hypothetical protein
MAVGRRLVDGDEDWGKALFGVAAERGLFIIEKEIEGWVVGLTLIMVVLAGSWLPCGKARLRPFGKIQEALRSVSGATVYTEVREPKPG